MGDLGSIPVLGRFLEKEVNENCRGPEERLVESGIAEGRSRMFELKC